MPDPASAITAVAGIAQGVIQRRGQKKAARQQRRAEQAQKRQQTVAALRQQRRARSQALNAAAAGSGGEASGAATQATGVQGAIGAQQSLTADQIGFANQIDRIRERQQNILNRTARNAGIAGAIGTAAQAFPQGGQQ